METLTVQNEAMTHQQGLNEVLLRKVNRMLENRATSVEATFEKMEREGKLMQDYITPIGVNLKSADRRPVVTFSANGAVNMDFSEITDNVFEEHHFSLHDNAVGQLATKMGIPTRYLKDLASGKEWQRGLASQILNQHCENTERSRMLVRCVGNEVRGVLSDSYRRLNSLDILMAFVKEATEKGAVVADALYTDTKMFVETLLPMPIEIPTIKNGTVVLFAGARFSTSDFGDGALDMRAFLLNGACLNGMVRESMMRQIHLGAKLPDSLALSEETYRLDTATSVSAVRDLTRGLYSKENIMAKAIEIQKAADIDVDFQKEITRLVKGGSMLKSEGEEVEKILMRNNPDDGVTGGSSLWKLTQAITAHAREVEPLRARELQEISGALIDRVNH